ncbi:ATP-binding protein [Fluviicola sp.]|uniref:ATP-binding protein n=1 Tax=Fluviicola sp. TaxID=1917219 RepID=UPI002607BC0F|nr:ATP-binding protein [Fluviicola sp.]
MTAVISYFQTLLHTAFALYFGQESEYASLEDIPFPADNELTAWTGKELLWEEQVVLLLALMPHVSPQSLDLFFILNKNLDRPYTEFGGWNGTSHNGFLPTGETAAFLLALNSEEKRKTVVNLFGQEHWYYKENILRLEGQGPGEPFLSGKLCVSDEFLVKIFYDGAYRPDYSSDFPARRMETKLNWEDLVLPYNLTEEIEQITQWLEHGQTINEQWNLDKFLKRGYRCLFHGPPGTGKTLTASLLGKQHGMDVYRIDLSMVVSKYIGETEKNLAKIFDRAEHQNWILFFDEADALFGKRTETSDSNDRHANQEVAYLLQRIEDFPGMVILATNIKDNLDEAFFRRFQSILYFPVPNQQLRYELWQRLIPREWLSDESDELLREAAMIKLSGGSMLNVVQSCALQLFDPKVTPKLSLELLKSTIRKELEKEGKLVN